MTDDMAAIFREELRDLVESLERGLLDLRQSPNDNGLVDQVFRDLHTIKGSGAMFGFTTLAGFIHDFETAFDRVREGKVCVTPELIRLGLAARDQIPALVDDAPDPQNVRSTILQNLQALTTGQSAVPASATLNQESATLTFGLTGKALALGARPDLVLAELATLGATEIVADLGSLPNLADLEPDACAVCWSMRIPASRTPNEIEEVFLFVLSPRSEPPLIMDFGSCWGQGRVCLLLFSGCCG